VYLSWPTKRLKSLKKLKTENRKLKSQGYREPCNSSGSSNNKNANHSWWQKAHNKLANKGESSEEKTKKPGSKSKSFSSVY